jgi:acyl carrier protein
MDLALEEDPSIINECAKAVEDLHAASLQLTDLCMDLRRTLAARLAANAAEAAGASHQQDNNQSRESSGDEDG